MLQHYWIGEETAEKTSIVNQKGGVAKTTSTHNIGVALAKIGFKVLVVDLDSQASLTYSVGIDPLSVEDKNIVSILTAKSTVDIKECIYQVKTVENLYILPSIIDLAQIELEMFARSSREKILERALLPIEDDFDFILIDCPPQLSVLTINALSCSDSVIIPVKTDELAFRGLTQLEDTIEEIKELINPKLEVIGVIATMFEKISTEDKRVLKKLEEREQVIGIIKKTVEVKKGITKGISIVEAQETNEVSLVYKKVAKKLITKSEVWKWQRKVWLETW